MDRGSSPTRSPPRGHTGGTKLGHIASEGRSRPKSSGHMGSSSWPGSHQDPLLPGRDSFRTGPPRSPGPLWGPPPTAQAPGGSPLFPNDLPLGQLQRLPMPSRSHTAALWGRCPGPPHGSQRRAALGVSIHTRDAPKGWRRQKSGLPIPTGTPAGGLRTAPQSPPGSPPPPTPLTRTVRVRDAVRGGGLHRRPRVTHGRWGAGVRGAGCWGRAGSRGAGGAQAEAAAVRARSTPTLPAPRPARLRDCGACARRDHRGAGGAPAPPPVPPGSALAAQRRPGTGVRRWGTAAGRPGQRPALRRGDCASAAARGKVSGLREEAPREGPGRAEAAVSARPPALVGPAPG